MLLRPLAAASILLTTIVVTPGRAQLVGTLGAGTGHVTYDNTPRATIMSLSPAVMFEGERTAVSAMGSFTRFDGGIWSAQGLLAGSRFSNAYGLFRGELSGQAETNSHRGLLRTGQVLAQARAHLATGSRGLWLGGGAGHAWRSPAGGQLYRADLGAWAQLSDATLRLTATQHVVGVAERQPVGAPMTIAMERSTQGTTIARSTARYLDLDAHVAWSNARVALDAAVGSRQSTGSAGSTTWVLGGSVMLMERVALVGATGATAFDIAQGLPGGRFASVALRFTTRPGSGFDIRSRGRAVAEGLRTIRDIDDGAVLVIVDAPRARRVELMGDFTDWRPMLLRREADGQFALRIHLPPGSYRVNVRVDGGAWTAPPGTTPVADEYNGAAGLIVIGT